MAPANPVGGELEQATQTSRRFFQALLDGDARGAVQVSALPFFLEERRFSTPDELLQELLRQVRTRRVDLLTLSGLELLSPADMEKRHGRPPARLSSLPWRGPKTYVAVATLSGHPAVAVVRDLGNGQWRVIGYHD